MNCEECLAQALKIKVEAMSDFKFKTGDRVTERPRNIVNVTSSPNGFSKYKKNLVQRYGIVTGVKIKVNARGSRRKFISVLWDGSSQSSDHDQMRLCAVEQLPDLTQSFFNGHAE